MDAPHLQILRKDRQSKNELRESVVRPKKTLISTSNIRREALEKVVLAGKRLVSRNATAQFTQALKQTFLLYWFVGRRSLSDLISSFGPHQRGGWNGKASDWHVRSTLIDDPHQQSQFQNDMEWKTQCNFCIIKRKTSDFISSTFPQLGCSLKDRAPISHAERKGIEARHLQFSRNVLKSINELLQAVLWDRKKHLDKYVQHSKEGIWNGSACWESYWCPESPRLGLDRRWSKRF